MVFNITILLMSCVTVMYFILPAYIANASGLVFGGGTPVDFNKSGKNNERLIGDGVTWRGLIAGTLLGTLTGAIQGYFGNELYNIFGQYIFTPICADLIQGIVVGFLLGFGGLIGDALGSFIKRRLGIKRGQPAPILDQLDFLLVALLLVSF